MKGTDCTQAQMIEARHFVENVALASPRELPDEPIMIKPDDLVRLIAWYGAVRFKAALNGVGTLENPGRVERRDGTDGAV